MTKKTQNDLYILLDALGEAKLKDYSKIIAQRYFIDEDENPEIWKRKKLFSSITSGFITFYETWNSRIIARVFFFWQGWKDKKKVQEIVEVQRYLAGSEYKLSRYLYKGQYGVKCLFDYRFYYTWRLEEEYEWEKIRINSVDALRECYLGSYYYPYTDVVNGCISQLIIQCGDECPHKYCAYDRSGYKDYTVFYYLALYEKHPQIELLAKNDLMWTLNMGRQYFRWSKKGLAILGLQSKDELKYLKVCPNIGYYRKNKETLQKLKIDSDDKFYIYHSMEERGIEITKKNLNYLLSQVSSRYSPVTYWYTDYINFVDQLGLPKTDKILYPKNLQEAHDELMNKVEVLKNKELDTVIQERVNKQLYCLRFADDNYIITPANSSEDLINESKVLNHCVRTYIKQYAEGRTNILLIRERKNVNQPFYTLELSKNKIIQLRGEHNCPPTKDVISFINKWAKRLKLKGAYVND